MKLVHTDIFYDLTKLLSRQATEYATQGKRVFYIAPNSLSFEKEKTVLEMLEGRASFDIIVTRFAQMARYFILNETDKGESLDDMGMVLLVTRVLRRLDANDLMVYGRLKDDANFVQQVCNLYHEFSTANLSLESLESLQNRGKAHDLMLIFQAIDQELIRLGYEKQSRVQQFISIVKSGYLTASLADVVVIIDGFTRFSAEEEELIALLNDYCSDVIVAAYASQSAMSSSYVYGDVYEASVTFLRDLKNKMNGHYIYLEGNQADAQTPFAEMTNAIEGYYNGTNRQVNLNENLQESLEIWEVVNQREEIETVARAIRENLDQGKRYKDHLVLLGDVDVYRLQIGKIFEHYQIPFYFGKAESMAHHSLVNVIDAIDRLYRYNFRHEDLIILMSSGLIDGLSDDEVNHFERYVHYMDLRGKAAFEETFSKAEKQFPNLDELNLTREKIILPLVKAFGTKSKTIKNIIKVLATLLEELGIMTSLAGQNASADEQQQENNEQVWKQFSHILETMVTVFEDDKELSFGLILSLLKTAMLSSEYRLVPATVDVVSIKSYDLIAPHTNKIVYAIGLTQSNFPKQASQSSMLSDEERAVINEKVMVDDQVSGQFLQVVSEENHKKNRYVALSLYNSASEKLVLSVPQIYQENQEELSIYLRELRDFGLPIKRVYQPDYHDLNHFTTYRALLSQFIRMTQEQHQIELDDKEREIWRVLLRHLKKRLAGQGIELPHLESELRTTQLSEETLKVLYPDDAILNMSVSSLTDYNANPYTYYLKHILHLKELDSIHPDARTHGNFLHRIFEMTMKDDGSDFDQRLEKAIRTTEDEQIFKLLYEFDDSSRFTRVLLEDIARSTATVLRDNDRIAVQEEEAVFGKDKDNLFELPNHAQKLNIVGKIDRLDLLDNGHSYGLVDYKSSDKSFSMSEFYNGMNSQLVTYIDAVKRLEKWNEIDKVFAAVYLHMMTPILSLSDMSPAKDALAVARESIKYNGLFIDKDETLNRFYKKTPTNTVSEEDLKVLIAYNRYLFEKAADQILNGHFPIAPYSKDRKSIGSTVDQHKSISHYESTLHFGQARQAESATILGKRKKPNNSDWIEAMKAVDRVQEILKTLDEEEEE